MGSITSGPPVSLDMGLSFSGLPCGGVEAQDGHVL